MSSGDAMITSQLQPTAHFRRRMSQRGIKQAYVDLALEYGKEMGDKLILDKKDCKKILARLEHEAQALKQILSRGGYIIVKSDEALITVYRKNSYSRNLARVAHER
mgnify:FL=1